MAILLYKLKEGSDALAAQAAREEKSGEADDLTSRQRLLQVDWSN